MPPPSPHPQPIRPDNQHSTVCSQQHITSPSTLALAANALPDPDLDARWEKIKGILTAILHRMQHDPNAPLNMKTLPNYWVAIYSGIASLYSGDNHTRKKRMYHHIRKFIDDHVGSQLTCLRRFTGEELLAEYVRRWGISRSFAGFMKRVLHHVQRYWIWDNVNTLKDDPVRPLDNLFMFYWREHLLTHMPSFVDVALTLVDDDRRGRHVPRHLIRGLVNNLLTIGQADIFSSPDSSDSAAMQQRPHTHSTLYLYQQLFEEPFIAATTNFYQHDGHITVNSTDVRAFIRDISASLRNEDERAAALLHPTSLPAVRRAAEEQLIGSHCAYLQERAKLMIESGSETDLCLVYNLLTRVDGGLTPVRNFFTAFVRNQGNGIVIEHVSALNGSTDIRKSLCLIDQLICLYLKHAGMVRRCLSGSNDFKLAIYDAFRGFVNRSLGPISLPVLLAHFADQVFRTKTTPVAFARAVGEVAPPSGATLTPQSIDDEHDGSTDGGAPSEDTNRDMADHSDNESEQSDRRTMRPDPRKRETDSSAVQGETAQLESTDRLDDNANHSSSGEHDPIQPAPQRPSLRRRTLGGTGSADEGEKRATSPASRPLKRRRTSTRTTSVWGKATLPGSRHIKRKRTGTKMTSVWGKSRRKGVQDEELSLKCLSEVVRFFMFLEEKDSFFEMHRMLFSKRLLASYDETLEKQFIVELEEQMGAMYTHRLRGMLRDIMTSDTMRKDFSAYLKQLQEIDERSAENEDEEDVGGGTAVNGDKAAVEHESQKEGTDDKAESTDGEKLQSLFNLLRAARTRGGPNWVAGVDLNAPTAGSSNAATGTPSHPLQQGVADDVQDAAEVIDGSGPAYGPGSAANVGEQEEGQNEPEAGASSPVQVEEEPEIEIENVPEAEEGPEPEFAAEAAAAAAIGAGASEPGAGSPIVEAPTQPVDQQEHHQSEQPQQPDHPQHQHEETQEVEEQEQVLTVGELQDTHGDEGAEQGSDRAGTNAPKKPPTGPEERAAGRIALSLNFNTHVLNALHWPGVGSGSNGLRVPAAISSCERLYQQFYMLERESRKLTWVRGMATAQILAHFGGAGRARRGAERSYTLVVSAVQMAVLDALNGRDGLNVGLEELGVELGIAVEEVRKAVRPLVVGRRSQVLRMVTGSDRDGGGDREGRRKGEVDKNRDADDGGKEKEGREEEETKKKEERVSVNEDFESVAVRVVVPTAMQRAECGDGAAARRVAVVDRNTLIDAAVVRVMKERKEVSFVELCTEVISRVSGSGVSVDSRTIKPRVERLIDMEYVERDAGDAKVYRYCA